VRPGHPRDAVDGADVDASSVVDASMPEPMDGCRSDADCRKSERCFKQQQCGPSRDVEAFICSAPAAPSLDGALVQFEMPVREFVSDQPPTGLTARACRTNDVTCADPAASFEDVDGTGTVKLELERGFDGFLEVRTTNALPATWHFTEPLIESRVTKPLRVVSPDTRDLLAAIMGIADDPRMGLVFLEAFDCNGIASGGIHFEEGDSAAFPFYIVDELPSTSSAVSVLDEADESAVGGFFNAPPGFTLFTARVGVDGPVLSEFNVNVRAGTVTYLDIHP